MLLKIAYRTPTNDGAMSVGNDTKNWVSVPLIIFFCCACFLLLITFFAAPQPKDSPKKPDRTLGLDAKDLLLYLEAITRMREEASFLDLSTTREKLIQETLKSYLAQKDAFSDYLTREEYRKFKESQDDKYVGVGMEIEKDRDGKIVCMPYLSGPAKEAGISVGDQLKSIDGIPVDGKSLFAIASMARGKRGTEVDFIVLTKSGTEKRVTVTRSEVLGETVSQYWIGKRPIIKIFSFTRNTPEKLRRILSNWATDNPIVIDLRSNAGGDLYAAIDSARLFLEKGKKIVSLKTRNGAKIYESADGAINLSSPIYLWQDEATASAAEVFISALTENNRAVSIGKRTFGKGTKQDIIELSDGSALVLTTGELQTPRGASYQGYGLNPTHPLPEVSTKTAQYMTKVEELTALKSKTSPAGTLNSTLAK